MRLIHTEANCIAMQAVYQSLFHLSWIDKLVDNIKTIFVDLYRDQLRKPHTSVVECDFDVYFDQQLRELEGSVDKNPPRFAPDEYTPPYSSGNVLQEAPPPIPGLMKGELELQELTIPKADNFFK